MKRARFKAVFNRKGKLNQKGEAPVEIQMYQDRTRRFIALGVSIKPENWDKIGNEAHEVDDSHKDYNKEIRRIIGRLSDIQTTCYEQDRPFRVQSITERDLYPELKTDSYIDFVRSELKQDNSLKPKTKVSHSNTLNKLHAYNKAQDVKFSHLDYSFVRGFLNYLTGEGLAKNTIHKQHKNLKKFIDLAINKGYYKDENPCKKIKVQYESTIREVLSNDEVRMIEALDLSQYDEQVETTRDMWLFAYWAAGRRISCVLRMKSKDVKKDEEGYRLDYKTFKANKHAVVPLHSLFLVKGETLSKPEQIIAKYWDADNEYLFPRLSEQYVNRNLKVIGHLAGLDLSLNFSSARHSFGTNMATKIPVPYLMRLMQHSDVKTTMGYVNLDDQKVKLELDNISW